MGIGGRFSRRQFLAAGAAVSAAFAIGRTATANESISVGVVGLGARGTALLDDLVARPDVHVAAVCDASTERMHRGGGVAGVRVFREWQELVQSTQIDAVVIATPDHWHAPMALAALAAGKDVYCERPMALSPSEAQAIHDLTLKTGRMLQLGVQECSEPQWLAAREIIEAGLLGPVRWCQGRCGAFSGGTVAHSLHAQLAPLLLALRSANPVRATALGSGSDGILMSLDYPAGYSVNLLYSAYSRRMERPAVIRGAEASLYVEAGTLRLVTDIPGRVREKVIPTGTGGDHIGDWLDAIRTRRQPRCGPDLALKTTLAIARGLETRNSATALARPG